MQFIFCYIVDLGSLEVWLELIHFLSHDFFKEILFLFEQIKIRYITKSTMLPPAQDVQKEKHRKIFTKLRCQKRAPPTNKNYKGTPMQRMGCFHHSW